MPAIHVAVIQRRADGDHRPHLHLALDGHGLVADLAHEHDGRRRIHPGEGREAMRQTEHAHAGHHGAAKGAALHASDVEIAVQLVGHIAGDPQRRAQERVRQALPW